LSPRFVVDAMLGKLARWLRILGLDVRYSASYSDEDLLKVAKNEGRIIVTRDRLLVIKAKKEGLRAILLPPGRLEELLALLSLRCNFNLEFSPERTRCPLCNSRLIMVSDPSKLRVTWTPPVSSDYYWVCPRCGHVYWKGRHFREIDAVLRAARRLLKLKGSLSSDSVTKGVH